MPSHPVQDPDNLWHTSFIIQEWMSKVHIVISIDGREDYERIILVVEKCDLSLSFFTT